MSTDTIVIFNADDFGLAPEVNSAVAQLCQAGLVRSASLLVTGPAAAEAIALAKSLPELSVGLHLALVHERPAADPAQVPALLDQEGRLLPGHRQFMARLMTGRLPLEQVRREAEAQLQRMLSAGLHPTHLDSHQHLHLWPPLLSMCLDLCRKFNIRWIRLPGMEALEAGEVRVGPLRRSLMKAIIGRARSRKSDFSRLCRTDGVWGMLAAGHLSEALLLDIVGRLGPGVHEIMCHPATQPCDQYTRHDWGYEWQEEFAALQSPLVADLLKARGLVTSSFREAGDCVREGVAEIGTSAARAG
ncbi:MAG: ChbG/HpnK family deacetylase [Armatimonadia bacterium]